MRYTTNFTGRFYLSKPLTAEHSAYLTRFANTRRMRRDSGDTAKLHDLVRKAVKLPIGKDGGYYVGGNESSGILDGNGPPAGQPGLWCQWVPTRDGKGIEWDGVEKFYNYTEWLRYLIEHFLTPWGYGLNGFVRWEGEDPGDVGIITVRDSLVYKTGPGEMVKLAESIKLAFPGVF